MVNLNALDEKPVIIYPTFWAYKVILEAKQDAKALFDELLKGKKFEFKPSNTSQNGKYQSYNLTAFVQSEKERLALFAELKKRAKFVL